MSIKTIVFDWGGVLIDNPEDGLINFYASFLKIFPSELKRVLKKYEDPFQKGKITESVLWKTVSEELLTEVPVGSLWLKGVNAVLKKKDEVFEIIKTLRRSGYKTVVLSNTEKPTTSYFFRQNYDKYFDEMIFSCDVGLVKPWKEIYELALKRSNSLADETIFIDDKQEFIDGAENVGIHGILFSTPKKLIRDLKNLLIYSP